jgi:hypothetical protein
MKNGRSKLVTNFGIKNLVEHYSVERFQGKAKFRGE